MRHDRGARKGAAGLLLLCLSLVGCATPPQTERLAARPPAIDSRVELSDVPFFPQDAYQCGPAALATALSAAGWSVSADSLVAEVYLPARRGSLQLELAAAARRHGVVAYVLAPKLESLLTEVAAGHPIIVLQNLALAWYPKWHYAVVVGYDLARAEVILRSGRERRHVVSLAVFERTWRRANHWALAVLPPDRLPASADEMSYLRSVAALERQGHHASAARAYEAALARWPGSLGALMGLGNARYAAGDLDGAERAYRDAVAAHPAAGAAFNNLAQTLADRGRFAEAESAARRAVALGGPLVDTFRATLAAILARAPSSKTD